MKTMPDFPECEPAFIQELCKEPQRRIYWDRTKEIGENELDLRGGLQLQLLYPDPENLLQTAVQDFQRFLTNNQIAGNGVVIEVREDRELSGEDFALEVHAGGISLTAGTTEGIRRGIYRLIAHLRSQNHPGLPLQKKTAVHYWLKDRISRCFFSPIKRAPFFRDELLDDRDYYPENYLSRLAESGVNGLWLTISLKEMIQDEEGRRRFQKLNENIRRCRRYGIKIWAFCIEPESWSEDHPLPEELSQLAGPEVYGRWKTYCIASPEAEKMLYDGVHALFSNAPGLGGMITISLGERITSCISSISIYSDGRIPCNKGCGLKPAQIVNRLLGSMERGMKDASPDARLVSWLYMPHPDQSGQWVYQLPGGIPPDTVMMANFESGCHVRQLGTMRNGGDYWLSAAGPSERFCLLAEHRKPYPVGAKLQVGCSHECATVPFVPVPGQLYRKYRAMKRLGVELVQQCWFFGNYPGVMNDAAGLLATDAVDLDERQFLIQLAKPDWGDQAEKMAECWDTFAAAYEYYPLDIQFQYFGPMHDGPVWPLYIQPAHRRLPKSWKPYPEPAGDALGECLYEFSIGEAAALTGRMTELWHEGARKMEKIMAAFSDDAERAGDFSVVRALDVQFNSGHNILQFYALRNQWLEAGNDAFLNPLRKLVRREIQNSTELMELCRKDSRLGYHSEAEVFKYFPAKLQWRIGLLQELLDSPWKRPDPEPALVPDQTYTIGNMQWKAEFDGEFLSFRIRCENAERENETLRFFFSDQFDASMPWYDLVIRRDGRKPDDNIERQTVARPRKNAIRDILQIARTEQKSEENLWTVTLKIPHAALDCRKCFRVGIQHDSIRPFGSVNKEDIMEVYPPGEYQQEDRLYLSFYSPEKLALFKLF